MTSFSFRLLDTFLANIVTLSITQYIVICRDKIIDILLPKTIPSFIDEPNMQQFYLEAKTVMKLCVCLQTNAKMWHYLDFSSLIS